MELSKLNPHIPPSQTTDQNDAVSPQSFDLVAWDPPHRNNIRAVSYLIILAVVVSTATVYTFSPSDSHVETMQLKLSHVSVHVGPPTTVNVSLDATVEVRNSAMYSLDYTTLLVVVGYRGKELGDGEGGHVSEMGSRSSYVDATVELDGVEVDLDDLAKGLIQFDTVVLVDGLLSFLQVPLKAKYSCEIDVDIKEQNITRQSCYPMAIEIGLIFSIPIPFLPSGQVQIQIVLRF